VGEIKDLFDSFGRIARQFGDLEFVNPGGTLNLSRRVDAVICVKFELPKYDYLHLATVLIEGEDMGDLRHEATVTTSSSVSCCESFKDGLFDPANTAIAIHTGKQHRPWLRITFDHPINVTRIFLRNRGDAQAVRARGLQVLARHQDGRWSTVYDGIQRERLFVEAAGRHILHSTSARRAGKRVQRFINRRPHTRVDAIPEPDGMRRETMTDLGRLLTAIKIRDDATVRGDLDRIELPDADKTRFKQFVNEWIRDHELEWNIHGINRTFRFWSSQEKADYIDFALDVITCLGDLNDNICFGFGAVLASLDAAKPQF
jgi:hypothetical protein